ncbi:MAG: tyrosine-type recombinase/integrase [Actinobacteria bacterium]|nr:tyrosine-type recombinase/integrase [Actinomycetota bacterium]
MSVVPGIIHCPNPERTKMSVRKRKDTKTVRWTAGWKNPSGSWQFKDFKTKAEAVAYEAQMASQVQSGDYANPHAGKTKLNVVYENWKKSETRLKPKTRATYDSLWKCLVGPKWGNSQISGITKAEVKNWLIESKSSTGNKVGASRMRQSLFVLNALLNHAVEMSLINKNVLGELRSILPKLNEVPKKRTLEEHELELLANECGENKLLILIAGYLGLRWAELVALTPEDFDFRNKSIQISKTMSEVNGTFQLVTTKSGHSRSVPILEFFQVELMEKVMATPSGTPVFHSSKGRYLRSSNFAKRVFIPALERANLSKITFHDLRHTAISHQIQGGADIVSVSKVAGHSSPATTLRIYAHELDRSQENIREAINKSVAISASNRYPTDSNSKSA